NPTDYRNLTVSLSVGQAIKRNDLISKLIFIQYKRNDIERSAGTFAVLGNTIEVNLPYQHEKLRIELFGDSIESLQWVDKHTNNVVMNLDNALLFPARHFVTTEEKKEAAIQSIKRELEAWAPQLNNPIY